jgi:regulator of nucleoside diphosphate kinase
MKPLTHDIVLTHFDHHRLHGLLRLFRMRSHVNPWNLTALELELGRARTVAPDAIPSDVITMNSKVVLRDLAAGERLCLTLVFPDAVAHDAQHVPVLSPLGLALLGCRVGDVLEYSEPGRPQRLLIEKIEYQPEARGNFFM